MATEREEQERRRTRVLALPAKFIRADFMRSDAEPVTVRIAGPDDRGSTHYWIEELGAWDAYPRPSMTEEAAYYFLMGRFGPIVRWTRDVPAPDRPRPA